MLEKFKSRKFLMTLLTVITGILTLVGVSDNSIEMITSVGMIVIPTIVYVVTEGKIDANSIKNVIDTAEKVVDVIEDSEK